MAKIWVTGDAGYPGAMSASVVGTRHLRIAFDTLSGGHSELTRWGPLIVGTIDLRGRGRKGASNLAKGGRPKDRRPAVLIGMPHRPVPCGTRCAAVRESNNRLQIHDAGT